MDEVLFGDVGKREGLSPRDRSPITVSVPAATDRPEQLNSHLRPALQNGLSQDELVEALTHLAFHRAGGMAGSWARRPQPAVCSSIEWKLPGSS
ncbi:carboxymuconolactone decarboxylase family protein [Streptomyces fulvoviolaceus]|uniref:carboxymuconolactone decarboxylase family protein n=1 Tax=Streptomyces fulvoviolaceus TaxID=285535 RepID=UPI0036F28CDB